MKRRAIFVFWASVCAMLLAAPVVALDLATFEKNITVETLDNGLTIIVYERPAAPVVSFFTHVDVGAAQEVPGITGLAHMFEHMAFKGTSRIGTLDYKAEMKAMAKVDEAYGELALAKYGGAEEARVAELEEAFEKAQDAAREHVKKNEFGEIIDREGGVGLNAFTNSDTTGYFFSLPANKVELWAHLESERFLDPVFREFYKERDVVQEERRMRTESNPIGRMIEQFQCAAFDAHPYGQPVVGYMSDLQSFTREDAAEFYETYYVPSNITVAVVGDVKAEKVVPLLSKYFGRLPAGEEPEPLRTVEPPSRAEKVITIPDTSQPIYVEGYHRPSGTHPDDAAYNAIADILSNGRTSRLYKSLVSEKKIAMQAGAFNGFPGTKYPHLVLFFGINTPGHSNEEVQDAIRTEIERIRTEPVSDDELQRVKTRAKASLIRQLSNNTGLAIQLATNHGQLGDWRELFYAVDKIEKVTKDDILRVAQETFVSRNRTVAMIVNEETE